VLLPRFKALTLTIAEDGIALRESSGAVRMLAKTDAAIDSQWIAEVLQENQSLLQGRTIDLVLSNKFLRFAVLPWQPNVVTRRDWNALATHVFRERYGALADGWKVKVSFGQVGERVVATAMDQDLYESLLASAKQLHFKWGLIEPLAARLLNQTKREYMAALIVEPQHLLLCEKSQSEFKDFLVMSPLAGEEATYAAEMLARWQLQQPVGLQSNPVVVYVSGYLKGHWTDAMADRQLNSTIVMPKQQYATNASWLTTV